MCTNLNLININVQYIQISPNQDFIVNKEIRMQGINENDIPPKYNGLNISVVPESINQSKFNSFVFENHYNNDQHNQNDILLSNQSNKYDKSDVNSMPAYDGNNENDFTNESGSKSNELFELQSSNLKISSSKCENYSRTRWTEEEEQKLKRIIKKIGPRKWNKVAEMMKTRTAKQCRDHYANCLNPCIKKTLWSLEEEQILMKKYQEYGSHWSRIQRHLPGRTSSMIKNYMRMLLKNNEKDKSDIALKCNNDDSTNEENVSYISSSSSSENDDQSFSINNTQNSDFNYHNISCLLNHP